MIKWIKKKQNKIIISNFSGLLKKSWLKKGSSNCTTSPIKICKIGNADVDDILNEFNNSYNNYIKDPSHLCTAFCEYANNEENLFITGGCYLSNTTYSICNNSYNCY